MLTGLTCKNIKKESPCQYCLKRSVKPVTIYLQALVSAVKSHVQGVVARTYPMPHL